MSEIEKIKRYVERTKIPRTSDNYGMRVIEMMDLSAAAQENPIDIVLLAFNYGRAKGYRAAKAEAAR